MQVAAGHELPSSFHADRRQVSHRTQRGKCQSHASYGLFCAPVYNGNDWLVLIIDPIINGLALSDELDDKHKGALYLYGVDAAFGLDVPYVNITAFLLGGDNEEAFVVVECADLRAMREW